MNYIEQYYDEIKTGKVITSKRVENVYKRLVKELKDKRWTFDEAKAQKPIDFIETFCKQSKGEWIGKPTKLLLFQKAFIAALFGFIGTDGNRRFNETFFLVARKNGKSTLLSGIMLYMLMGDGEGGSECYSVATKKDQARITFNEAVNMVQQSPYLSKYTKKRKTDIYFPLTFGKIEALASDSNSLDGLNSHCVVVDELHAIKDRALYEVMKQSMSARRQPLFVMITTSGTVRECIYDDMYEYACKVVDGSIIDDRFLPILYELDEREEWLDFKCWEKANPALGTIKKLSDITEKVERAKANPKDLSGILCKDFNVRDTVAGSWLNFEEVNNLETYDLKDFNETYCIGGVDLSSTTDLTCSTLLWAKAGKIFVNQMYFIPREVADIKEKEDKVPYAIWEKLGWITFTEGSKVELTDVTNWFLKQREENGFYPLWIGYDNWGSQYWTKEMESNGFKLEVVIQGAKTMSAPMKNIVAEFRQGNINYNNNPILKWCLTNTTIKQDENDNIRPVKGKSQRQRIDGAVSLIDAFVVYYNHFEDYRNMTGG